MSAKGYNRLFAALFVLSVALGAFRLARHDAVPEANAAPLTVALIDPSHVTFIKPPPPPHAPTDLSMEVIDRRKTSFRVCWTAPSDWDGKKVHGFYTLKIARKPIDSDLFNQPTYVSPDGSLTAGMHSEEIAQVPSPPIGEPGERQCSEFVGYIETGYYAAVNVTRYPANATPQQRNDS